MKSPAMRYPQGSHGEVVSHGRAGGACGEGPCLRELPQLTPLLPLQLDKNLAMSKHTLEYGMRARQFDASDFQDQTVTRILKKLSVIERAALPEDELKEVSCKGTGQDGLSFATTLWEDTGFAQLLGNGPGQLPLPLQKVIVWYLLPKSKTLTSRISHPKVACPSLLWGTAAWVAMAHCMLAPYFP